MIFDKNEYRLRELEKQLDSGKNPEKVRQRIQALRKKGGNGGSGIPIL